MVTISKGTFTFYQILNWVYIIYFILDFYIKKISNVDKETERKFKHICKMEFRNPIDQKKLIINEYVNNYSIEHGINWEEIDY